MPILAIATCLFAILLAGCSSSRSRLPNIYLTELSYRRSATGNNSAMTPSFNSTISGLVGNSSVIVRTGYFGVCIASSDQDWTCHKDARSFATIANATQDPLDLLSNSMVFRDGIIFSGLVYVKTRTCKIKLDLTKPKIYRHCSWRHLHSTLGPDSRMARRD